MEMMSMSLRYASKGLSVFPLFTAIDGFCSCGNPDCKRVGKHPVGRLAPHGCLDATTDADRITEWWSREPEANIGIRTGEKVVVLDIDPRHGGPESLAQLERELGPLPATVRQETGGGGYHLLFQSPLIPLRCRNGIRPGIDLKGSGGYIVVAPSLHQSGKTYRWNKDETRTLCPMPDSWIEFVSGNRRVQ